MIPIVWFLWPIHTSPCACILMTIMENSKSNGQQNLCEYSINASIKCQFIGIVLYIRVHTSIHILALLSSRRSAAGSDGAIYIFCIFHSPIHIRHSQRQREKIAWIGNAERDRIESIRTVYSRTYFAGKIKISWILNFIVINIRARAKYELAYTCTQHAARTGTQHVTNKSHAQKQLRVPCAACRVLRAAWLPAACCVESMNWRL